MKRQTIRVSVPDGTIAFARFLCIAYATALVFEFMANTMGGGGLFNDRSWEIIFFLWYGFWYTLAYLALRKLPIWQIALAFVLVGIMIELFVLKRPNLFLDSLLYAFLGVIPFWVNARFAAPRKRRTARH